MSFVPPPFGYVPPQGQGYPPPANNGYPGAPPPSYPPPSYPPPANAYPAYPPQPQGAYPGPNAGYIPPQPQAPPQQQGFSPYGFAPVPNQAQPSPFQPYFAGGLNYLQPNQVEEIVMSIRSACKGVGTDEKQLAAAFSRCLLAEQTEQVISGYKQRFGTELRDMLAGETSGNFGKLCKAFATSLPRFDAEALHHAVSGMGTDEDEVCEIICGRSNAEMYAIKAAYFHFYNKDLEHVMQNEFSGHLKKLYVVLVQGARDEANQINNVDADVEALYKAGEGKIGTDESSFIAILCHRGEQHLRNVFSAYAQKHGRTIEKVVEKEFGGSLQKALLAVVRAIKSRPEFLADSLEASMAGMGTHDERLIRLVVRNRNPNLMKQIKEAYINKHGKSLGKRIKGETSGCYENMLLALIGEN